jgi:hypothetical protein
MGTWATGDVITQKLGGERLQRLHVECGTHDDRSRPVWDFIRATTVLSKPLATSMTSVFLREMNGKFTSLPRSGARGGDAAAMQFH